jgi:quercetin dioxygenase-like cupin family protein
MSTIALLPGEGKQLKLGPMGIGVVFKLYSEDTGGRFALVEHPMAPGTFAVPHVHHNEDEYSYVLEGEVGFQLGDKVTYARPGGLIAKPRDIWHAFWNESATPARVLEIMSPGGMERYFEDIAELFAQGRIMDAAA